MSATRAMVVALASLGALAALGGEGEASRASQPAGWHEKPSAREAGGRSGLTAQPAGWHEKHSLAFQRRWGAELIGVRRVASGLMLRVDYRVLDPDKAVPLASRKVRPYVIDEATGIALAVPALENVGELRQVPPLEVGRTYFVIFGNPGGLVKPKGRVTLVAGALRAEGLEVQ